MQAKRQTAQHLQIDRNRLRQIPVVGIVLRWAPFSKEQIMLRMLKLTGVVALVFGASGVLLADEAKGSIKTVDSNRKEVVIKGLVKDTVYELDKNAMIWLDGFRAKITDLSTDDRAVIVYEKRGDHLMASSVRGLRKAQEASGTVNDVFKDKKEVTLKGTVKNTTYELTKNGTVWINGKQSTLTDIRAGDEVLVTYEQRGDRYVANDVTVLRRK
jgi:hypothetical protein